MTHDLKGHDKLYATVNKLKTLYQLRIEIFFCKYLLLFQTLCIIRKPDIL